MCTHRASRRAQSALQEISKHSAEPRFITTGEQKMTKTIILSICLAASLLSLDARAEDALTRDALAQNDRQYSDGPVTEVNYIQVEYGRFPEYIDWLNSTWKPTMEAMKKAGLLIDYKVFQASPKSPDQPNVFLYLTFKNMAAYGGDIGDKGIEAEYVARKVIGSTEFQNKKRVERTGYRKVLGTELIREVILK
jgi:hypothetical protein